MSSEISGEIARFTTAAGNTLVVTNAQLIWIQKNGRVEQIMIRDIVRIRKVWSIRNKMVQTDLVGRAPDVTGFKTEREREAFLAAVQQAMLALGS